jgi:hypothetical protein
VKESVPVHESQSGEYLQQNNFYCVFGEMRVAVFDQLIQIFLHVLEYEIKNVIFTYDFLQFHHIGVGKFLQRLNGKKLGIKNVLFKQQCQGSLLFLVYY